MDRAGDLLEQLGDIVVPRRGQRVEQHRAVGVGREHTVGDQSVRMAIEVEHRSKALHDRDGTAVGIGDAMGACSSALPGEHLVQKPTDDLAQQVGIAGEQKPNLTRYRQHPLSVRHGWENAVDEVRCGVCHSPTCARRTEPAGLARERDQPLLGAGVTAHAYESSTEQATSEKPLELALHEAWIAEPVLRAIARLIEQRWEVVTDNAVEHRALGLAAGITTRGRRRGMGGEHVRGGGEAGTMPLGRANDLGGLGLLAAAPPAR